MDDAKAFNAKVIEEFRANGGKVGAPFEGMPLTLITTAGAKSGRALTTPLAYGRDGEDIFVIASAAGAPKHPAWFHNLSANPAVTVEVGDAMYEAAAVVAEEPERRRLYDQMAKDFHFFEEYERTAAPRVIPVVRIVRA